MKNWLSLAMALVLFGSACGGGNQNTEPLRGWNGQLVSEDAVPTSDWGAPVDGVAAPPSSLPLAGEARQIGGTSTTTGRSGWLNPEVVFDAELDFLRSRNSDTLSGYESPFANGECEAEAAIIEYDRSVLSVAARRGITTDARVQFDIMAGNLPESTTADFQELFAARMASCTNPLVHVDRVETVTLTDGGDSYSVWVQQVAPDSPIGWTTYLDRNNLVIRVTMVIAASEFSEENEAMFRTTVLEVEQALYARAPEDEVFS